MEKHKDERQQHTGVPRQIISENLLVQNGHLIVTSINGTPLNDLQMPMIINQTNHLQQ